MAVQQFFYDAQIERFLVQFIRMISGFQVEFGNNTLQRVPVYYGDGSRQVAQIIANNSGSTMPTVPAMTVYINGLTYDRDRVQEPTFVGKMHIRQRQYNDETQEYEASQGNAFTIERAMPVPYTIELKVDVWTSNTKQKLQLLEQIIPLFNPALEIQSTDNYIDWTSLSVVYLDSPNWSSRVVPIGTDNPIDVATLTFKLPVWISPPAKVKKLGVIQKIIASIHDSQGDLSTDVYSNTNLMGNRQYFTPMDYGVLLIGNNLTLLKVSELELPREPTLPTTIIRPGQFIIGESYVIQTVGTTNFTLVGAESNTAGAIFVATGIGSGTGSATQGTGRVNLVPTKVGTPDLWRSLINVYGVLENGLSQVRLLQEDELSEIVGTVSYHPTDDTLLIFNPDIDTLPANTLDPINAIIDPYKVTVDTSITSPAVGTRYLILKAIGSEDNTSANDAIAWQGTANQPLVANANDIIEWDGTSWSVSFDSLTAETVQYVSNLNTGTQYKWNLNQWVKSWEGEYKNGTWSLVL
jgi:hypothetical protein